MTLPASGTISLQSLQTEFSQSPSSNEALNGYYKGGSYVANTTTNASIPASGQIALSNFYSGSKDYTFNTFQVLTATTGTSAHTVFGLGETFLVSPYATYTAWISTNNGVSWTSSTPTANTNYYWYSGAISPSLMVLVGDYTSGGVFYFCYAYSSNNGVSWTVGTISVTAPQSIQSPLVTYANGIFTCVCECYNTSTAQYNPLVGFWSTNGTSWTGPTTISTGNYIPPCPPLAVGTGFFCPLLQYSSGTTISGSAYITSSDGKTWSAPAAFLTAGYAVNCVAYGNGFYVAVGGTTNAYTSAFIATSTNGTTWTTFTTISTISYTRVVYSPQSGTFIIFFNTGSPNYYPQYYTFTPPSTLSSATTLQSNLFYPYAICVSDKGQIIVGGSDGNYTAISHT